MVIITSGRYSLCKHKMVCNFFCFIIFFLIFIRKNQFIWTTKDRLLEPKYLDNICSIGINNNAHL